MITVLLKPLLYSEYLVLETPPYKQQYVNAMYHFRFRFIRFLNTETRFSSESLKAHVQFNRKTKQLLSPMRKRVTKSIKRTVDKSWPDDLNGIEAAHHTAEREAHGR